MFRIFKFALRSLCVRFALTVTVVSILASCTDPQAEFVSQPSLRSVQQASPLPERPSQGHEDEEILFEISREAPSYGGHFQAQDGSYGIWVANSSENSAAVSALRRRLANRRIFSSAKDQGARINVIKADFSLRQLAAWRDLVLQNGAALDLVMVDLDEGRNRVTVGVEPGNGAQSKLQIEEQLTTLGIPSSALRIIPAERPTSATMRVSVPKENSRTPRMLSTLASYADTLVGGLRIRWWESGVSSYFACTLGYTASISGGGYGFLSASHCSPSMWGTDGTSGVFGQPSESYTIGYELYDPGPGTCPWLWGCSTYRFSDANFNLVTSRDVNVGYLAGPSTRNNRFGSDTTINSGGYYIPVVGITSSITQGSTMDQIGATTGWLYSTVDDTCIDFWWGFQGKMSRCAYRTTAACQGGDSGGPVFYYLFSEATATGIVFAKSGSGNGSRCWFSKMMYVQSELSGTSPGPSSFNIQAPSPPPTPTAAIHGPADIKPSSRCYWYVSASFEYTTVEWKVNGNPVGTDFDLTYSASSSFLLEVAVTNGFTGATDSRSVSVSSQNGECYVE